MAKTRLTQSLRNSVKVNIEADIPRIDYSEIIANYIQREALKALPTFLKELVDAHPTLKEYLAEEYQGHPFCCYVKNVNFAPTAEHKEFAKSQRELQGKQRDQIEAVSRQINAWLNNAKTVEELIEQAPQFAKYLPAEQARITTLPAVQLAEELSKLGWPKTGEANGQN